MQSILLTLYFGNLSTLSSREIILIKVCHSLPTDLLCGRLIFQAADLASFKSGFGVCYISTYLQAVCCWTSDYTVHHDTHTRKLLFQRLVWQRSKNTLPVVFECLIGCFSCSIPRRQFVDLNRWRSPIRKRANEWERWETNVPALFLSLPQDRLLILEYRYKTNITSVSKGKHF